MKKYGPMSRYTRKLCGKAVKNLEFNSVLDVGCGEGSFLKYLRLLKPGITTSGVDVSEKAIECAKNLLPEGAFYVADLERQAVSEKFDLVTAIDVLEHITDDVKFLENVRKSTKKYFFIYTLTGSMRPHELSVGHVRNYSQKELADKLKRAGFSAFIFKKWGFPFYSPIYRNLLQHVSGRATTGKFGFFKKFIAIIFYFILHFNISNKGDIVLVLASPV